VTGASLAPLAAVALVLGAPRPCPAQAVAASERFELHSDPWINLHHFLYQWARDDLGLGTGRQEVRVPERSSLGRLAGAERRAWERALEFYRDSVAARSHFDEGMLHQKRRLVAYWIREGFPRLRGWSAVVPAAQEDWLPVVRGETSPERGFEALVGRFAAH
jgi:hypothetical protein